MRHRTWFTLAAGVLSGLANEAIAQHPAYIAPAPQPVYQYAVPLQPTYVQPYRWALVPQARRPNPTGYVNRPYYGAYGYGIYSNGSTDGFPPFRGRRSR